MIQQPSYTADDVFNALRREPRSAIEQEHPVFTTWIQTERRAFYKIENRNRQRKLINKIHKLLRTGGEYTLVHTDYLDDLDREAFELRLAVTGWTVETYIKEVDEEILQKQNEVKLVIALQSYFLLCIYCFSAALSFGFGLLNMWMGLWVLWLSLLISSILAIYISNIIPLPPDAHNYY